MKGRSHLVLFTLAVFCAGLLGLGIYRAILHPMPFVLVAKEYPSIGSDNAPVEIVVFEDFLCHTCRYFSMEVFPALETTYVNQGLARYVMVPLAFSSHSREVANAALAVFHQTPWNYFPYVQELFSRYSDAKKLELSDLVEVASTFTGIDMAVFEASVKEGRFDSELENNFQVARKAMKKNLRTPAVFINGFPMPGISFESISVQIESILSQEHAR